MRSTTLVRTCSRSQSGNLLPPVVCVPGLNPALLLVDLQRVAYLVDLAELVTDT